MSVVPGTYRKGKVKLDAPVDWQDGQRVTVAPAGQQLGLNEADWPDSPETRAELLRRYEALEPLEFTDEERAEIHAALEEVRQASLEDVRKQMGLKP